MATSPDLPRSATDVTLDTAVDDDVPGGSRLVRGRRSRRFGTRALSRMSTFGVSLVGTAAVIGVLVVIGGAVASPHAAASDQQAPASPSTNGPVGALAVILAVAIVVASAVVALRWVFPPSDETDEAAATTDRPTDDLDDLDDLDDGDTPTG